MKSHDADWDDDERRALEAVRDELDALRERHRAALPLDLSRAARTGALPEDFDEQVRARLEASAWDRALVEGAEAAEPVLEDGAEDRILSRIRQDTVPKRRPWWSSLWVWGPAVAAAAAVLIVVFMFAGPRTPAPDSVTARVALPATTGREPPVYRLPLDKPDVRFTAEALVLRGHPTRERFVDVVAPAVAAYRANDYATAAHDFAALQDRYPASVEVFFYLGISRLFTSDWPGAIDALAHAKRLDADAFGPEASWYLAIAYDRAGRRAEARDELSRLCDGRSAMAGRACDARRKLE